MPHYPTYSAAEKAAKAYAAKLNAEREADPAFVPFTKGARKFDHKFVVSSAMTGDPMVSEVCLFAPYSWVVKKFRYAD